MQQLDEQLFSIKDSAETLGVSVKTLQRWYLSGRVKVVRSVAHSLPKIPKSELERLLKGQAAEFVDV